MKFPSASLQKFSCIEDLALKLKWRVDNRFLMDTLVHKWKHSSIEMKRYDKAEGMARSSQSLILRVTWTNLRHFTRTLSLVHY